MRQKRYFLMIALSALLLSSCSLLPNIVSKNDRKESSLEDEMSSGETEIQIEWEYDEFDHWPSNEPNNRSPHDYKEEIIEQATYNNTGRILYSCKICSYSYIATSPALNKKAEISFSPIQDSNDVRLTIYIPDGEGPFSYESISDSDMERINQRLNSIGEVYFGDNVSIIRGFPFHPDRTIDIIFSPSVKKIESMVFYSGEFVNSFIFEGDAPEFELGALTLNGGLFPPIYCNYGAQGWDMDQVDGLGVNKIGAPQATIPNISLDDFYYQSVVSSFNMIKNWVSEAAEKQLEIMFAYPYSNTMEDYLEIKEITDQLVVNCATDLDKADTIFNYVKNHIKYSTDGQSYFPIDALKKGKGVCYQYMCLMHDMLSSQGILDFHVNCLGTHYSTVSDALNNNLYTLTGDYNHAFNAVYIGGDVFFYDACWGQNYGTDYRAVANNYYVFGINDVHFLINGFDASLFMATNDSAYPLWKDGNILPFYHGKYSTIGMPLLMTNFVAGSNIEVAKYNDGCFSNGQYELTGVAYRNTITTYNHSMSYTHYHRTDGLSIDFSSVLEFLIYLNKTSIVNAFFAQIDMHLMGDYLVWKHNLYWDSINKYRIVGYFGKEKQVIVPSNIDGVEVEDVGYGAFANNPYIKEVSISSGIEQIWSGAFSNCSNFTDLYIPASVNLLGGRTPDGSVMCSIPSVCDGESNFVCYHVDKDNNYFKDINGVLYSKDMKTLIHYPQKSEAIINLSTVEIINDSAFAYSQIRSVVIPNNVRVIEQNAFKSAAHLEEVEFQCGQIERGEYAFYNCSKLTSLTLSPQMKSIPTAMFIDCVGLGSIDIPEGVQTIGEFAFADTNLYHVSLPSTITSISRNSFSGCNELLDVVNNSSFNDFANYKGLENALNKSKYSKLIVQDEFVFYKDSQNCILVSYLGNESVVRLPATCDGIKYIIHDDAFKVGYIEMIEFNQNFYRYRVDPCIHPYLSIREIHIPKTISTNYKSRYLNNITYYYE